MIYKINGAKVCIEANGILKESEYSVTYRKWELKDRGEFWKAEERERMEIEYYNYHSENGGIEINKEENEIIYYITQEGTIILKTQKELKTGRTKISIEKNRALARRLLNKTRTGVRKADAGLTQDELMFLKMKMKKQTKEITSWEEVNMDKTEKRIIKIRKEDALCATT